MFHTKTLALLLGIAPFASIFMANAIPIDNSTITRRQAVGTITELEGNGNPHQNYLHQQISEIITCDQDAGCSAGESITESFSVSWSFGIGKKVTEWISGGFSVQESWSTGNNYVCQGAASDTVCIWYNTAHTAVSYLSRLRAQRHAVHRQGGHHVNRWARTLFRCSD